MEAEYSSETLITIYQTSRPSQKTVIYIVAEVETWNFTYPEPMTYSDEKELPLWTYFPPEAGHRTLTGVVYSTGWDDLTEHIEDRRPSIVVREKTRKWERNHGADVTTGACKTGEMTAFQRGRPSRPYGMHARVCNALKKSVDVVLFATILHSRRTLFIIFPQRTDILQLWEWESLLIIF